MGRLIDFMADNASDLLFNFSAFIIVYLIARLLKSNMLVAACFGVLPLLVAYLVQHPGSTNRLIAMLN